MSKTVTFLGMEGTGATRKEALADARSKLEALARFYFDFKTLYWRGQMAIFTVVNSDGPKVAYRIMEQGQWETDEGDIRTRWSERYENNAEEAEVAARYELAQNTWNVADGFAPPSVLYSKTWGVDRLLANRRDEFTRWAKWQTRYLGWKALSVDDNMASQLAMEGLTPPAPETVTAEMVPPAE